MVARRMSRGRSIEVDAAVQEAPTHCVKGNTSMKPVTGNQCPCRNESSGVCLPEATGMDGQESEMKAEAERGSDAGWEDESSCPMFESRENSAVLLPNVHPTTHSGNTILIVLWGPLPHSPST